MNEKEKFEQEFAEDGSFKVQGTPNDVWKWIEQHDQRILEEFVEYMTCGNEDHIGMEYTVKEFKDNLEQFRKERNK